jgi:hypothetical protein
MDFAKQRNPLVSVGRVSDSNSIVLCQSICRSAMSLSTRNLLVNRLSLQNQACFFDVVAFVGDMPLYPAPNDLVKAL